MRLHTWHTWHLHHWFAMTYESDTLASNLIRDTVKIQSFNREQNSPKNDFALRSSQHPAKKVAKFWPLNEWNNNWSTCYFWCFPVRTFICFFWNAVSVYDLCYYYYYYYCTLLGHLCCASQSFYCAHKYSIYNFCKFPCTPCKICIPLFSNDIVVFVLPFFCISKCLVCLLLLCLWIFTSLYYYKRLL